MAGAIVCMSPGAVIVVAGAIISISTGAVIAVVGAVVSVLPMLLLTLNSVICRSLKKLINYFF